MTKFGDTKAADTEFHGNYDIDGWVKPRELEGTIFNIQSFEFRTSSFDKDKTEYVMFITVNGEEDRERLKLPDVEDGFGVYGVSGTHQRIVQQLRRIDEEELPIENVTLMTEDIGRGNPVYFLADPTTSEETEQASTRPSPKPQTGRTGGQNSGGRPSGTSKTGSTSPAGRAK